MKNSLTKICCTVLAAALLYILSPAGWIGASADASLGGSLGTSSVATADGLKAALSDSTIGVVRLTANIDASDPAAWQAIGCAKKITGSTLTLPGQLALKAPVTFENITLQGKTTYILAAGNALCFNGGVNVLPDSSDPSISSIHAVVGGANGADLTGGTSVVLESGWVNIVAGGGLDGSVQGNTSVKVGGTAQANSVFGGSYGSTRPVTVGGNALVEITGNARVYQAFAGGKRDLVAGSAQLRLSGNASVHAAYATGQAADGGQNRIAGTSSLSVSGGVSGLERLNGDHYNDGYTVGGGTALSMTGFGSSAAYASDLPAITGFSKINLYNCYLMLGGGNDSGLVPTALPCDLLTLQGGALYIVSGSWSLPPLSCAGAGERLVLGAGASASFPGGISGSSLTVALSGGDAPFATLTDAAKYADSLLASQDSALQQSGSDLLLMRAASSISVSALPKKTTYEIGNPLDLTGGMLQVTYPDGTERSFPLSDLYVSGFSSSTSGTKELTVDFCGCRTRFSVRVFSSSGGSDSSSSRDRRSSQDNSYTVIVLGIPANNTVKVGQTFTLTPIVNESGKWDYDKHYFTGESEEDDSFAMTFTAHKAGASMIRYLADGASRLIVFTIKEAEARSGVEENPAPAAPASSAPARPSVPSEAEASPSRPEEEPPAGIVHLPAVSEPEPPQSTIAATPPDVEAPQINPSRFPLAIAGMAASLALMVLSGLLIYRSNKL